MNNACGGFKLVGLTHRKNGESITKAVDALVGEKGLQIICTAAKNVGKQRQRRKFKGTVPDGTVEVIIRVKKQEDFNKPLEENPALAHLVLDETRGGMLPCRPRSQCRHQHP